jgi:hypothetical protein
MRVQRSGALHRQKAGSDLEDTSERPGFFTSASTLARGKEHTALALLKH